MLLVPWDAKGLCTVRKRPVMTHQAAQGHCEITFENVRVPAENLLGEEGGGFALAQARLGPGRIHHCMRSIGQCEVALVLMIQRSGKRTTFGKKLHEHGTVGEWITLSPLHVRPPGLLPLKSPCF